MKTQKLEDDRFDVLYINYNKTFKGNELKENEIVYHARKLIAGKLHWREVKAPISSLHTSEGKEFYISGLEKAFDYIKHKILDNG